jgi:hypothetical protein
MEEPNRPVGSGPTASNLWPVPEGRGRTFVLAIDAGSFGPGDVPPVVRAAREFIDKLEANDLVGVFTLPRFGSRVDPTTDRAPIRRALDSVAGQRQTLAGQYNLSPSEIIDITAETGARFAGGAVHAPARPAGGGGPSIIPAPVAMNARPQRVQVRECRRRSGLRRSHHQRGRRVAQHSKSARSRASTASTRFSFGVPGARPSDPERRDGGEIDRATRGHRERSEMLASRPRTPTRRSTPSTSIPASRAFGSRARARFDRRA